MDATQLLAQLGPLLPIVAPLLSAKAAWLGEALLRWLPPFPYTGERRRAFVALVSLLSLACTVALHWAAGTLGAVDPAQVGQVVIEAALAVVAVVAAHRGRAPGALPPKP